jgi:hypothetical protein
MPWMIDDKRLIAADFVESSFTWMKEIKTKP